ncbi:MAG: hypothetical protein AB7E84_16980 [Xanthobacteraceae bacterium]
MGFSKAGPGLVLADAFDSALAEIPHSFPHTLPRGKTLFVGADFGGSHAGQLHETYSFVLLDLDQNAEWLSEQRNFRRAMIRSSRRMSFKSLNDRVRRRALVPFLQMGNLISGWLVTFAISRNQQSLFQKGPVAAEPEQVMLAWKDGVRERLMRVLHLTGFLLSGLSCAHQDVLWVTDEDEIASNVDQLTHLTRLFAVIASNSISHQLGHLRCATTKSDDGSRAIEDLVAYCDLAAGTTSEAITAMGGQHHKLQSKIISPAPSNLTWKTRLVTSWLAYDQSPLRRLTCVVDLKSDGRGMKTQMLRWHALPGNIIAP